MTSAPSNSAPVATDFQRACSLAIQNLPITFQKGDNVSDFGARVERWARLSTGQPLHPLHSYCGLLDNSDNLEMLPLFLLPPGVPSLSTVSPAACLRRRGDIDAIAQVFCGGDIAHARLFLASDVSPIPTQYTFSTEPRLPPLWPAPLAGAPSSFADPVAHGLPAASLRPPSSSMGEHEDRTSASVRPPPKRVTDPQRNNSASMQDSPKRHCGCEPVQHQKQKSHISALLRNM